jgi:hypothetical protein
VNVFVLHTPFQRFVAEHMLRTMSEFAGAENFAVVDEGSLELDTSLWTRVQRIAPPLGSKFIGNTERVSEVVTSVIAELGTGDVTIFMSNPDYPLSNGLVRHSRQTAGVRLASFPEGVLNALPAGIGLKKRAKNVVKWVYGQAVGCPFSALRGDNAGLTGAHQIYTLIPDALGQFEAKLVRIPPPAFDTDFEAGDDGIICGQPLTDFMSTWAYLDYTRRLIQMGVSITAGQLFFKPHPREPEQASRIAESEGALVLRDTRIVEEVVTEMAPALLLSFSSSALLHVKLFFEGRVRCVAAGANDVMRHSNNSKAFCRRMERLYRDVGVEWTELPQRSAPRVDRS